MERGVEKRLLGNWKLVQSLPLPRVFGATVPGLCHGTVCGDASRDVSPSILIFELVSWHAFCLRWHIARGQKRERRTPLPSLCTMYPLAADQAAAAQPGGGHTTVSHPVLCTTRSSQASIVCVPPRPWNLAHYPLPLSPSSLSPPSFSSSSSSSSSSS